MLLYHNRPGTEQPAGRRHAGREAAPPSRCRPTRAQGGIYGDFIHCVKTREKPFRDIELAVNTVAVCHLGIIAYELQAVAEVGRGQAGVPRRRGGQSLPRSRPPRAVAAVDPAVRLCHTDLSQITVTRHESEMLDMLDQAFEALKTYDWGTDRKRAEADRRRRRRHARRRRRPQGAGDPAGRRARRPTSRATPRTSSAAS